MTFSDKTILSVKQLNDFAKRILDNNLYMSDVTIEGEISNFTNHYKSGHFYFSVKDSEAQIRCVMFSSYAQKLKFELYDGMNVRAHGRVSLFVRDGQFIFYVDKITENGTGELYRLFEELKQRLRSEGLFDNSLKKPIPKYPRKVGVITSDTGAAIQDILNISKRRYPAAEIIVRPCLVQGRGAEAQLCACVKYFSERNDIDVVIIGRGGGSIEDLWAFNSEKLAREIFKCSVPVISAVGHETDFTICDFVSDLRAPTPSAAAELALPDAEQLKRQIQNVQRKLNDCLSSKISIYRMRIDRCAKSRFLLSPKYIVDEKRYMTFALSDKLVKTFETGIFSRETFFKELSKRLYRAEEIMLAQKKENFALITGKLEALNPMSVISRGYCAVFTDEGRLIKSVDDVTKGQRFSFKTRDGKVIGEIISKRRNNNAKNRKKEF